MKKALTTLNVGDAYRARWERLSKKSWTAYCERHGYDLVPIEAPLDASERARKRSPSWQKCLILGHPGLTGYDRVVWVDSDILINPLAPSIVEGVPPEKIGAIDESVYPSAGDRPAIIRMLMAQAPRDDLMTARFLETSLDPGEFHGLVGLPKTQRHIVQAGVMVLSPVHHRTLLENVYNSYEDLGHAGYNYEMRPLSHEIQSRGWQHWIDPRFNALLIWLGWLANLRSGARPTMHEMRYFIMEQYLRNYFLHFAGCGNLMDLADFASG